MNQLHCELWQDAQKLTRMESQFKALRVEDNEAGIAIIVSYLYSKNAPSMYQHCAKMLLQYVAMCHAMGEQPCLTPWQIERAVTKRLA